MANMKRRRESSPFETACVPKEHPATEKKRAEKEDLTTVVIKSRGSSSQSAESRCKEEGRGVEIFRSYV